MAEYDSSLYSGSEKLLSCFLGSTDDDSYENDVSRATPEDRARMNIDEAVSKIGLAHDDDDWESLEANVKELVSHYDSYKNILRGLPGNWYIAIDKVLKLISTTTRAQLKELSKAQRSSFSRLTDYLSAQNLHPVKEMNNSGMYSDLYEEIIQHAEAFNNVTEDLETVSEVVGAKQHQMANFEAEVSEDSIRPDSIVVSRVFEFFKITFDETVEEQTVENEVDALVEEYRERIVIQPKQLLEEAKSIINTNEMNTFTVEELHNLCSRCLEYRTVLHVALSLVENIIERGAPTSETRTIACNWLMMAMRIAIEFNITGNAKIEDILNDKIISEDVATNCFTAFSKNTFVMRLQNAANAVSRFSIKAVPLLLMAILLADYYQEQNIQIRQNLISQLASALAKDIYHITNGNDRTMFQSDISKEPMIPSFKKADPIPLPIDENDEDTTQKFLEIVELPHKPTSSYPSKDYNNDLANGISQRLDVFFELKPSQRMEYLTHLVINSGNSNVNISLVNREFIANFKSINMKLEEVKQNIISETERIAEKHAAEKAAKTIEAAEKKEVPVSNEENTDRTTSLEIMESNNSNYQPLNVPDQEALDTPVPKKIEIKKYYTLAHEDYIEPVVISQTIISEPKLSTEAVRGSARDFINHFFEKGIAPARFGSLGDDFSITKYYDSLKEILPPASSFLSLINCDAVFKPTFRGRNNEQNENKSQILLRYAYSLAVNGDWMRALSIISLNPYDMLSLLKIIDAIEPMERTNQQNKILAQKLDLMLVPPFLPSREKQTYCQHIASVFPSNHYLFYRAIAQIGFSAFAYGDVVIAQSLLRLVSDIVLPKFQHKNKTHVTCTRQRFIPTNVFNSISNQNNYSQNIPAEIAAYLAAEEDRGSCPSGEVVDMILYVSVVLNTAAELSKANSLQNFVPYQKIAVRKVLGALSQGSMNVSPKYVAAMLMNSLLKFKIDDLKKVGDILLQRITPVFKDEVQKNIVDKAFRVTALDCFFAGVDKYMSQVNYKKLARQFKLPEEFIRSRIENN